MADAAIVFACTGCCCGQPDHGGEMAPPRVLKAAALHAFKAAGLEGRVRLTFTDCLGPCSEANTFFVYFPERPLWFRRVNTAALVTALARFVAAAADALDHPLPPELAPLAFSWTGGGIGPPPPVDDAVPVTVSAETAR